MDLIFVVCHSIANTAKIESLEIFRPYGIVLNIIAHDRDIAHPVLHPNREDHWC